MNERVSGLVSQRTHILDDWRQFWALSWRSKQRQNAVYIAQWTEQISTNSVGSEECSKHISTSIGSYTDNSQVAVCALVLEKCLHLPDLRQEPVDHICTVQGLLSRASLSSKLKRLLPRPYRSLGSRQATSQTCISTEATEGFAVYNTLRTWLN